MYNILKLLFLFLCIGILPSQAEAIQLLKKRVILTPSNPVEELVIINDEDQEMKFKTGWTFYEMHQNGRLKKHKQKPEIQDIQWADQLIPYSGGSFTLQPGAKITLPISFSKNASKGKTGEYRAHLWIYTQPPIQPAKAKSMSLGFMTGLVIPVFVRLGEGSFKTHFSNVAIQQTPENMYSLSFSIQRDGNYSTFGNINIYCINGQDHQKIKTKYGYAIYTEISQRDFSFEVARPDKECSEIKMDYVDAFNPKRTYASYKEIIKHTEN